MTDCDVDFDFAATIVVNGVAYAGGTYAVVDVIDMPRDLPCTLSIRGQLSLPASAKRVLVSALAEGNHAALNLRAIVGEGAQGADGFIALFEGGSLMWVAFFDFSNPFESVCICPPHVKAVNNLGELWSIPLSGLGSMLIEQNPCRKPENLSEREGV